MANDITKLLGNLGKLPDTIIKLICEYYQYWWVLILILIFFLFYFVFFSGSLGVQIGANI